MSDRADDRGLCSRSSANNALVTETEQVLKVATTTGDDDDIDEGVSVKRFDRGDHLGRNSVTLHGRVHDSKLHPGPTQLSVSQDVFLSVRVFTRNQADALGQKWQPLLTFEGEEPLAGELFAQTLQALE